MKRLVALLFALLFAASAGAVDLCTVAGIGAGTSNNTTNSTVTPALPATYNPGDLLLLFWSTWQSSGVSASNPSGYTLITAVGNNSTEIWGKIAGPSESAPSITAGSDGVAGSSAFIVALHDPGGFPAVGSILGDFATSSPSAVSGMTYRSLPVTVGGGCPLQFSRKIIGTGSIPTGVAVNSGYVAAGFAAGKAVNSPTLSAQMYVGDATIPDLASNTQLLTGNTDASATFLAGSLTLLSGDVAPTGFTTADLTNQHPGALVTDAGYTVAGITNYAPFTISGTGCEAKVNSGNYTAATQYPGVGDVITRRTTTSTTSGATINCPSTLGSASDTWSVTTDSTAPTYGAVPAQSAVTSDNIIIVATATDSSGADVVHHCSTYASGSGAPTAAQVVAGTGTGVVASSHMTATVTSGSQASMSSGHVLSAGTTYDEYCEAQDDVPNRTSVQKVTFSTSGAPASDVTAPVILKDTVTGANGTSLAKATHNPDVDTVGGGWVVSDIDSTAHGTATIQSNQASIQDHTGIISNVGLTDMVIDVQWITQIGFSNEARLIMRDIDKSNLNFCDFSSVGGVGYANAATQVAGVIDYGTNAHPTFTAGNTYRLTAISLGTSMICMVDGVNQIARVTSANSSGTKGGIGKATGVAESMLFDNLYIKRTFPCNNASTGRVNDDPTGLFQGETNLASGCAYWAKTIPTRTYVAWGLFQGGGWVYNPEIAYVGADTFDWERWNPALNAVESDTWTFTTQGVAGTAPVWGAVADQVWPISTPASLDLAAHQTTRGVPPSTCTVQAGALVSGMVLNGPTCLISGSPQIGSVSPTSVTIRATSTALTADVTFTQTITGDQVPDFPAFTNVTNATPSAVTPCPPAVVLTGTNVPSPVTVSGDTGAKYSLNAGAYTASAGSFNANDTVEPEVTAGSAGVAKVVTVVAGGVSRTCTVTATAPASPAVDDFSFQPALGVVPLSAQSSCTAITGNTALSPITVSGGTCTQTGGACPGNLPIGGGTVCALHTASALYNTPTNTLVTIGGTTRTFTSVTELNLPVCTNIPTFELVKDVTQFQHDFSQECTGATSWADSGGLPSNLTRSGSVVGGVASAADNYVVQLQAINNSGVTNFQAVFHVRTSADAASTSAGCTSSPVSSTLVPIISSTVCGL